MGEVGWMGWRVMGWVGFADRTVRAAFLGTQEKDSVSGGSKADGEANPILGTLLIFASWLRKCLVLLHI